VNEIMTKQAANTNEPAAEPNSAQHEDRTPGRLQDQIAVVTGASSGIGRAIALALAKEGAQTYLLGRELETAFAIGFGSGIIHVEANLAIGLPDVVNLAIADRHFTRSEINVRIG